MMKLIFVQFMANRDALFEHPVVRVQYTNFYYSVFYLQQNNDGATTMVKIKEMREFHTLDQVVDTTHLQRFS